MIVINVSLEDAYSEAWPIQNIVQELQQFIDVLSFEFNRPIYSLRASGYSLKKNDGLGMSQVCSDFIAI